MGATASTGIRFFVAGEELVKKVFDELGSSGKKMWAGVASGQEKAVPGMRALSNAANEVKSGLDDLISRAGPAGSVIAGFGATGVALAAALGGVVVALGEAKKAMEFGAEIEDTARKIGVGTDALQEYRFAVTQTGGAVQDADQALEQFSQKFGAARAGFGKELKPFASLGFTPEQLKGFKTAEDILPELTRRIGALGSTAEQNAISEKLGITAFLPAIRSGADGLDKLRERARTLGVVMDEGLVKKAAEAKNDFEAVSLVVDVQLKSAFVNLAPILVGAIKLLAEVAKQVNDIASDFERIQDRSKNALQSNLDDVLKEERDLEEKYGKARFAKPAPIAPRDRFGQAVLFSDSGITGLIAKWTTGPDERMTVLKRREAQIRASLAALDTPEAKSDTGKTGGTSLLDPDAAKTAAEQLKRFQDAMRAAQQRALSALDDETKSIEDRLDLGLVRLEAERAANGEALRRQVQDKELTEAQARTLKAAQDAAVDAQEDALARKALRERTQADLQYAAGQSDFAVQLLHAQADMAKTLDARNALELRIFDMERAQERAALAARDALNPNLTADQRAANLSAFDAVTSAQRTGLLDKQSGLRDAFHDAFTEGVRGAVRDGALGFLEGFFGSLAQHFAERLEQNLADKLYDMFADIAIKFVESIASGFVGGGGSSNSGLASLIVGGIGAIFGAAGFGQAGKRAAGGSLQSGFAYEAGEQGTELALIGRAGQVYNAADTMRMLTKSWGQGGGTNVTAIYSPTYGPVTGSGPEVDALRKQMAQDRAEFGARVTAAVNDGISRRRIKVA